MSTFLFKTTDKSNLQENIDHRFCKSISIKPGFYDRALRHIT